MPKKTLADYKRKFDALQMSLRHHEECLKSSTIPEKRESFRLSIEKNLTEKREIRDRLKRIGFKQWNPNS